MCAQGEYQENYEQKECLKCPPGTTTEYIGTVDDKHCVDEALGSKSSTSSSTHEDRNRIIAIAVGVSVAVLIIIGRELAIHSYSITVTIYFVCF